MIRLAFVVLVLVVSVILPLAVWGDDFQRGFAGEAMLQRLQDWGGWGWAAVIALLMADLFLPIPGTAVMSAAGYVYGGWVGGMISATGSVLSGLLAYGLCRQFGRPFALKIAGEGDLSYAERLFQRRGPWLVVFSRWIPLLSEVVACLAGLVRMKFGTFTLALACGSVPMGFAYAAIGADGHERPQLALALSTMIPPILWAALQLGLKLTKRARAKKRAGV